jgi:hypothetical protein
MCQVWPNRPQHHVRIFLCLARIAKAAPTPTPSQDLAVVGSDLRGLRQGQSLMRVQ